MDALDPVALATWESQIDLADELLAEIASGRTSRPFLAVEIEAIRAERARFVALISAYKAQLASAGLDGVRTAP